jgi:hypothetical protein
MENQLKLEDLNKLEVAPSEDFSTEELLKELTKAKATTAPADRSEATPFQENAFENLMKEEAAKNNIPTDNGFNNINPINAVDSDTVTLKGSELISEELALDLIDSIMCSVSVVVADKVFNKKINKSAMQLTAREKSTIEPVLKKVLDKLNIDFSNPYMALAVTFGAVYGAKGFQVISQAEEKPESAKEGKKDTPQHFDENGKPLSKYMMKKKGLL